MTQTEREQVEKLRKQGVGYAAIAARVGLSKNTVKSFCKRNTLMLDEPVMVQDGLCPHCGGALPEQQRGKPRRFCSDACRSAWWYAQRRPASVAALAATHCAACGKSFRSYESAGRKYCSRGCYIKARFEGGMGNDERAI